MNSFTEFPATDATVFLAQTELFSGIDPELFAPIARDVQTRKFHTDQLVCGVGEAPRHVFVVVSGLIKRALLAESGHESVAELVAPGQSFGETEFFSRLPFAISAIAVESTVLLCLDGAAIRSAANADPRFGSHLIALMASGRLRSESERAVAPTRSSGERVLDYLIDLAEKNKAAGWGSTVKLVTTKQLIAARIGLTPETFSRALRQLSVEGKILVDRRHVTLREAVTAGQMASVPSGTPFKLQTRLQPAHVVDGIGKPSGQHPTLATINVAGRQRMLSQQMSKFWLMIQHGITARHAHNGMHQAIVEFDQQLAKLNQLEANDGITRSLNALSHVWRPYKSQLTQADSHQAEMLLALGEKVLRAADDLTMKYVALVNDQTARLVNLAGRQRMLSQQLAKLYLLQCSGTDSPNSNSQMQLVRQEFCSAMLELQAAATNEPVLKRQLRLVSNEWSVMTTDLEGSPDGDVAQRANKVSLASERVVKQLESVVDFYSALEKAA